MKKFQIKDIFPNPIGRYFTFTFISDNYIEKNKLQVIICNKNGQPVISKEYDKMVSFSQYTVKTDGLSSGIYDAIFIIKDVWVIQKITVEHTKP